MNKIFEGNFDEEVHSDFLKFGRGEYKDRYLVFAKKSAGKIVVKTSSEFANFLVKGCLKKISGNVAIKGIIVSTINIEDELGFEIKKKSNFQGIRKLEVEVEVDAGKILGLMEKYPRVFFALSFKGNDFELKIKAKAPKSGKPSSKDGEAPTADFCVLKTSDVSLANELLFGVGDFKEVKISHLIKVEDIVYPAGMDKMKPEEIREKSKRKGVIVRKLEVDGNGRQDEAEFEA